MNRRRRTHAGDELGGLPSGRRGSGDLHPWFPLSEAHLAAGGDETGNVGVVEHDGTLVGEARHAGGIEERARWLLTQSTILQRAWASVTRCFAAASPARSAAPSEDGSTSTAS